MGVPYPTRIQRQLTVKRLRRAVESADQELVDELMDVVVARRRSLAEARRGQDAPERRRAGVSKVDMENWRAAVRLRSDVDASVIVRLIDHAWSTELLLEQLTATLDGVYAHLEASGDGQFRRWRCCLPTDADGAATCDAAGRWIYVHRGEADRIVSRGLAGHLAAHWKKLGFEKVRSHPMVGDYVPWDEASDEECDQMIRDDEENMKAIENGETW